MENAGNISKPTVSGDLPLTSMSESEILFVTSFGADMWEATGRRLLASFYKSGNDHHRFFVGIEGFNYPPIGHRELVYDLGKDQFLLDFLENNKDVIPAHLGGETTQCNCKDSHEMHCKHHVRGCYWHWMNRNASRWFRKVVTYRAAAALRTHRYLLWVDSDSVINQKITVNMMKTSLQDTAMFYFRAHREAPETGLLGIDLANGGAEFIDTISNRYASREYLSYHRWDDGFVTGSIVDEKQVSAVDVCKGRRYTTNNVIPGTVWGKRIRHEKGSHGRRLGVMT